MIDMHSEFWFALLRDQYKGSNCWAGSSISSRISRYINLKLTFSIAFVCHIDVHIQKFSIYTKLSKTMAFEKSVLCYCCIRLVISLALPLSLLPFTFGTRMVFLQWNASQCVQIWIINISNTDLFTQIIYLWYKYYSKWLEYWQSQEGPRRALRKFAGAMLKFFKRRSKVTFKVTCRKLRFCRKGHVMRNTHAKYECPISWDKKVMANVKVFEKSVNGHGEGHMLKMYGTTEKASS